MARKQCEGYTLSGSQCRRPATAGYLYCSVHNRTAEIGLPPYVTVNGGTTFWVYLPLGYPNWKVGVTATTNVSFKCLANGYEYSVDKYVSEGTYGTVYFCTVKHDGSGRQVAVKVSKEIFSSKRESDFLKEFYVHSTAKDRVRGDCFVKLVDAFVIKTRGGMHGCIAVERMNGCLSELYDKFETMSNREILLFWALSCLFMAESLLQLHAVGVYHMDMKPSNVMWRKSTSAQRGFVLKLIDFGLGCYLGGNPPCICRATGTYIPPEWRKLRDKHRPTFARISNPQELQSGECYALSVSCHKMLKRVQPPSRSWFNGSSISTLVELLEKGRCDDAKIRGTVSIKSVADAASNLIRDIDSGMDLKRLL